MAQTGFTPISIYYSATAAAAPTAGNLVAGELAINTNDGKLYYKDSSGVVQTIASKAGALGDVVGPASATDNALARFDATTGKLIQNSVGILSDAGALTGITDFTYTGALTGGTGVVNLGSGQFYKSSAGLVGIGTTSPTIRLDVRESGSSLPTATAGTVARFYSTGASGFDATIAIVGGNAGRSGVEFSDTDSATVGRIYYDHTSNFMDFFTSGAERMRIDSTGNVGIGTTSPSGWNGKTLSVASTTNDAGLRIDGNLGSWGVGGGGTATGSNSLRFYNFTSSFEAMRIDSSGNVLIGQSVQSGNEKLLVLANQASSLNVRIRNDSSSASAGAAIALNASGNTWGIECGSSAKNSNALTFLLDYNGTNSEKMRIDSSGNLLVGKTAPSNATVGFEGRANGVVFSTLAASTSGSSTMHVYSTGASAYRFYVTMDGTVNATSIVISAISDERLKENIKDIDTGLNSIMALKPRRFDWKDGKGQNKKNVAGFIAQEFETVFPECVGTSKSGEDGIEYKNINHETLIPTLVKAIQELNAKVTALEAQLATK